MRYEKCLTGQRECEFERTRGRSIDAAQRWTSPMRAPSGCRAPEDHISAAAPSRQRLPINVFGWLEAHRCLPFYCGRRVVRRTFRRRVAWVRLSSEAWESSRSFDTRRVLSRQNRRQKFCGNRSGRQKSPQRCLRCETGVSVVTARSSVVAGSDEVREQRVVGRNPPALRPGTGGCRSPAAHIVRCQRRQQSTILGGYSWATSGFR